jgi:beta-RFAP synthase
MTVLQLEAPSRLHLGLVGWGLDPGRAIGGVGIMLNQPVVRLRARASPKLEVVCRDPRWLAKTTHVARMVMNHLAHRGQNPTPLAIEIEDAPEPHVGLGSGTAVTLAIIRAILIHHGVDLIALDSIAADAGRGKRSGVGFHGSSLGGFIVDAGRRHDRLPAPLFAREPFPETWRIVLVRASRIPGLSGGDEERVFATLEPPSAKARREIEASVAERMLPAIRKADLHQFGAAVELLQDFVGRTFASTQGGAFGDRESESIGHRMRDAGLVGVGQSSWGPTLFGFAPDEQSAQSALESLGKSLGTPADLASANNHGTRWSWSNSM